MVWTNSKIVLGLVLAGFTSPVAAQELLWRVTSEGEADITPQYAGELNPFPQIAEPAPIVEEVMEEDVEVIEEPPINATGAALLETLRAYLRNGTFAEPNIYTLQVDGYMKGLEGPRVLLDGHWMEEGESVSVPARKLKSFQQTVAELTRIAPELLEPIQAELDSKISKISSFDLKIVKIEPDILYLEDQTGEQHVISYLVSDL